jgi:hypothetical protein
MAACGFIKPTGEACKAIPMRGEGWCYVHHPQYQERRRREGAKGGRRGGRGRPVVELRAIEDKLESLADNVLNGTVEPGIAAVVVQIRNAQIRAISTGLKAKEIEEIEARISELETLLEAQEERRWG